MECEKQDRRLGSFTSRLASSASGVLTHRHWVCAIILRMVPIPQSDIMVTTATRKKVTLQQKTKRTLGVLNWEDQGGKTHQSKTPNWHTGHSLLRLFQKWVPLRLKKQVKDPPSYCRIKTLQSKERSKTPKSLPVFENQVVHTLSAFRKSCKALNTCVPCETATSWYMRRGWPTLSQNDFYLFPVYSLKHRIK